MRSYRFRLFFVALFLAHFNNSQEEEEALLGNVHRKFILRRDHIGLDNMFDCSFICQS